MKKRMVRVIKSVNNRKYKYERFVITDGDFNNPGEVKMESNTLPNIIELIKDGRAFYTFKDGSYNKVQLVNDKFLAIKDFESLHN
jgi:hypothetical protein